MEKVAFIAAGGAAGALLRYWVAGWSQGLTQGSFPIGTLIVNVVGCALIGVATACFAGSDWLREEIRIGLLVGLLGAFTTFSTFGWQTIAMISDGEVRQAVVYVLVSNVGGLGAVWLAHHLARRVIGA